MTDVYQSRRNREDPATPEVVVSRSVSEEAFSRYARARPPLPSVFNIQSFYNSYQSHLSSHLRFSWFSSVTTEQPSATSRASTAHGRGTLSELNRLQRGRVCE